MDPQVLRRWIILGALTGLIAAVVTKNAQGVTNSLIFIVIALLIGQIGQGKK
ncbi:hypothetical protein HY086_02510 [Candidatus Gottesmanbacteria bacterium]|nr:hypothetical protein [Candidatus Gottesmanbacteria bacterium]